jgi:hypothetical protein
VTARNWKRRLDDPVPLPNGIDGTICILHAIFLPKGCAIGRETFSGSVTLVLVGSSRDVREMEPRSRISDNIDIDHKTSRSICDEVGERLQQDLSLEASPLPPYLDRLIDELRKQDEMIA